MYSRNVTAWGVLVVAAISFYLLSVFAAAEDCHSPVQATEADWRALSHGNSHVAAMMTIATADGRRFTGSQVNYLHMLVGRAEGACAAGQSREAMARVREARALLQPDAPLDFAGGVPSQR